MSARLATIVCRDHESATWLPGEMTWLTTTGPTQLQSWRGEPSHAWLQRDEVRRSASYSMEAMARRRSL